jgi:hypothetical protein
MGVPHFFSVFFACLYQRYLSENIAQPSAVFLGIEEHEVKNNINKNKNIFFTILSTFFFPKGIKIHFPNTYFFLNYEQTKLQVKL